jgi:dTDP-4-amino-4,6-dideoxygalactose transaminase
VAEEASLTSLALPIFPELKTEQKEYVVQSIREFFA